MIDRIKKAIEGKLNPYSLIILAYRLFFSRLFLILLVFLFAIKYVPINYAILLNPLLFITMVISMEYMFYKKKNYSIVRILIVFFILYGLQLILFQYIFYILPLMILIRKLDFETTFSLSYSLTIRNFGKILLTTVLQFIIMTFIMATILSINIYFFHPEIKTAEQVYTYTFNYSLVINILATYVYVIQYYLIYKNIEYNDVIKGSK